MEDDVIVETPVPTEGEEFSIIVDDEAQPQKDEATLALEQRIAELEAEKQQMAQATSPDVGFAKLAEQLAQLKQPTPPTVPEPTKAAIDPNKLLEDVNKNFYDNPAAGMMKLLDPILNNIQEQNRGKDAERDMQISKLAVLADDNTKGTYNKYKDEVEQIVATMEPSQTAYREALNKVRLLHVDDIINERVEAEISKVTEAAAAQAQTPTPAQFTSATQVQTKPPVQKEQHETVKKQYAPLVQKWMLTQGMDWNDSEDRNWALRYLKDRGEIQ